MAYKRGRMSARRDLLAMVRWYAANVYGRLEGPGATPFYADRARVGAFAVAPAALARGDEAALHQVVATLAMYQSRRDVDVMAIQRGMATRDAAAITSPYRLRLAIAGSRCAQLRDAATFDAGCDVRRALAADGRRGRATCAHRPRTPCHVKDATAAIGRMGDMGMLATSAWLHVDAAGGYAALLAGARAGAASPAEAADRMVAALARVRRIGTKLATMIVSALAVDELAPGLAPWAGALDAHHLVVVDANVMRVIDVLRPRGPRTYAAYAAWLRARAAGLDLRQVHPGWPRTSARLVQQALYWFRSRANRDAVGLACDVASAPCAGCVPRACAYVVR